MNQYSKKKTTLYYDLHIFASWNFYLLFLHWVIQGWETAFAFDATALTTQDDRRATPASRGKSLTKTLTFTDFLDTPTGNITHDRDKQRTEYYYDRLAHYFCAYIRCCFSAHPDTHRHTAAPSRDRCLAKAYSMGYLIATPEETADQTYHSPFANWTLFHFKQAVNQMP